MEKSLVTLPIGTTLFRRTEQLDGHLKHGRFLWCKETDPRGYGNYLHEYSTLVPMRLMDVTSQAFRDTCRKAIDEFTDLASEREELCFPFGLEGFVKTLKTLKRCQFDGRSPTIKTLSHDIQIKLFEEFDGCMRTSVKECDVKFTAFLKNTFGHEYDGYISRSMIPSMVHDAFPTEVCLFAPAEDTITHTLSTLSPLIPLVGGGDKTSSYQTVRFGVYEDTEDEDPLEKCEPSGLYYKTVQFGAEPTTLEGGRSPERHGLAPAMLIGVIFVMAFIGSMF